VDVRIDDVFSFFFFFPPLLALFVTYGIWEGLLYLAPIQYEMGVGKKGKIIPKRRIENNLSDSVHFWM